MFFTCILYLVALLAPPPWCWQRLTLLLVPAQSWSGPRTSQTQIGWFTCLLPFLVYFYPFQFWSGSWLGLNRRRPRSSQTRRGDFVRLSAGGILNSQFLDPILCQFVGRSRNMFALLILTTTASAQDYCAITPKHTACGQKVKLKCFDCKRFSVWVWQQLGILNPSAKLSASIWWRVLTKDVSGS